MKTFSQTRNSNENLIVNFLKGLILSMVISFALVVLFAFLLKWFEISDTYIFAGTMIIKALSVALGAMLALKARSRGLAKGILFGIIYVALAFVTFSALSGSFSFDGQTALDFVSCAIIGGIVGIIKVNKN